MDSFCVCPLYQGENSNEKPTISQYLLSTCLFAIDELNEQYKNVPKEAHFAVFY